MASRVAASLLNSVGLSHLVARSFPEYEEIAVHLALNPGVLSDIRRRLEASRMQATLFDTQRWVRNFENAIKAMWNLQGRESRNPVVVADCFDRQRLEPVWTIAEDVYDRPISHDHVSSSGSHDAGVPAGNGPYSWVIGAPAMSGIGIGVSELELVDAEDSVTEYLRVHPSPARPVAEEIAVAALAQQ